MRERNDFLMDTKGYCLLCLKLSKVDRDLEPRGTITMEDELEANDTSTKVFSLQRVCHYLRLNMRNVFKDLIAAAPTSSASVLEKSELKGVLCGECSEMTETVSDITLELEVLQMTLDELVKKMRDKVEDAGRDNQLLEGFKREMESSPQTLIHFGIVEQLRKETLKKCSLMIGRTQPRVVVEKLGFGIIDLQNLDGGSSSPPPPPSGHADTPEIREATPVISLVRGSYSYHVDDSYPPNPGVASSESDPDLGMEPSVGVMDVDAGMPIFVKVEREIPMEDGEEKDVDDNHGIKANVIPVPKLPIFERGPIIWGPEGPIFKCQFCPASYSREGSLDAHRNRNHMQHIQPLLQFTPCDPKSDPKFQCLYCPMRFSRPGGKSTHMKKFHNHLSRRQRRQQASQSSSSDPDFLPGDHEQGTSSSQPQVQNSAEPGPAKNYRCRRCHMAFTNKQDLHRHRVLTHYNTPVERKHVCETCGKRFIRLEHLRGHQKSIHEGERYPCPLCSTPFTQRSSVKFHMKNVCPKRKSSPSN